MKHFKRYFWLSAYFVFVWLVSATLIALWTQKGIVPHAQVEHVFVESLPHASRKQITEGILPFAADEGKLLVPPDQQTYLDKALNFFPDYNSFVGNTFWSLWIVFITDRFREFCSKRKRKKKRNKQ